MYLLFGHNGESFQSFSILSKERVFPFNLKHFRYFQILPIVEEDHNVGISIVPQHQQSTLVHIYYIQVNIHKLLIY